MNAIDPSVPGGIIRVDPFTRLEGLRAVNASLREALEVERQRLLGALALGRERRPAADRLRVVRIVTEASAKPAGAAELLTHREEEVLKCIAEGFSTKETASRLGITFKTAACHRHRIMQKLGVHETTSLVRFAIRSGLVEP